MGSFSIFSVTPLPESLNRTKHEVKEHLMRVRDDFVRAASDHYPLVIEFKLPKRSYLGFRIRMLNLSYEAL